LNGTDCRKPAVLRLLFGRCGLLAHRCADQGLATADLGAQEPFPGICIL